MSNHQDESQSHTVHHKTDPKDRVSLTNKIAYGCGAGAETIMNNALKNMANPIYNIALHINPALISTALGISRLWDAISDPLMGNISDNSRTRFGRRKPFMAAGALLSALAFILVWAFPSNLTSSGYFIYFLITSIVFYTCSTIFVVPYAAMGFELSPDYHERTRIFAWRMFCSAIIGLGTQWMLWFTQRDCFENTIQGMRYLAFIVAAVLVIQGLIPVFIIREREQPALKKQPSVPLLASVKSTLSNHSFHFLILALLAISIGIFTINHLGLYLNIYHVYGGNLKAASTMQGITGSVYVAASLVSVPIMAWFAIRMGKRTTMMACLFLGILGSIAKWFCYTPDHPWLMSIPALLLAPGYGSVWTLGGSMVADICDEDELNTGQRREAMYGAIYSWTLKMGVTLALLISGFVLVWTGFHAEKNGDQSTHTILWMRILFTLVPMIGLSLGLLCIYFFPLTEQRAYDIRKQLEKRRNQADQSIIGES